MIARMGNQSRLSDSLIFILLIPFSFISCSTIENNIPPNHIIMFDRQGEFQHPCELIKQKNMPNSCKNDFVGEDQSETPDRQKVKKKQREPLEKHLTQIYKSINEHNENKITIFIHGGMNSEKGALRRVSESEIWGDCLYRVVEGGEVKDKQQKECSKGNYHNDPKENQYPIFVNWDSGLFSSYADHSFNIRQGEEGAAWEALFAPVYWGTDLARAIARSPIVISSFFQNDLKTLNYSKWSKNSAIVVETDLRKNPPSDDDFILPEKETLANDNRSVQEKARSAITYWSLLPFKLVGALLLDSLGPSSWDNMLRKVSLLFRKDHEFHPKKFTEKEKKVGMVNIQATGGMTKFLNGLAQHICENDNDPDRNWEISLVGHSMGTIVINEMVRNFQEVAVSDVNKCAKYKIKMSFKNIVYMGSASTIRDFETSVVPYLESNEDVQFYNLMLHPLAEIRETNAWDVAPRGSLLVWLDNFIANPLTHRDRTLGRYENFMVTLHDLPKSVRDQIHINVFEVNKGSFFSESRDQPQEHTDFTSNYQWWNKECWETEAFQERTDKDCHRYRELPKQ